MRKKLKWAALGLVVVLVLVCAGVPVILWGIGGGQPNVAVDYVAKLNERAAAVPEGDRAWPYYRDATIAIPTVSVDTWNLLKFPEEWPSDRATVEAGFAEIGPILELIRAGASKPGLGFVTTDEQPAAYWAAVHQDAPPPASGAGIPPLPIGGFMPYLGSMRQFAKLLYADAVLAAELGEADRFLDDIDSVFSVAAHVEERRLLLDLLVGIAIRALAYECVTDSIAAHPELLDGDQLARLAALIGSVNSGEPYKLDLTSEGFFFEDMIQRMYTDDGAGGGSITASGTASFGYQGPPGTGPRPTPGSIGERIMSGGMRLFSSDRRDVVRVHDELLDNAAAWAAISPWERPAYSAGALGQTLEDAERFPQDIGMMMLQLSSPVYPGAYLGVERLQFQHDSTMLIIALARWRAQHGVWPDQLDDLVPGYLPSIPVDPFTGGPLRYVSEEPNPLLYSIGTDRDDDGGRAAEGAGQWFAPEEVAKEIAADPAQFDGDWVLFSRPDSASGPDEAQD